MNTTTKTNRVKTTIRRPSRFQQNHAGYELTVSGLVMGRAIAAVQEVENDYTDLAGDIQEGALVSNDAWNVVHARYDKARRKLQECRHKAAAGQTCANRQPSEPTYPVRPAERQERPGGTGEDALLAYCRAECDRLQLPPAPSLPPSMLCAVCGIANIHGPRCFGEDCPRRITN